MTESTYDVPVWTLATEEMVSPLVMTEGALTSARLNELRTVLAALVDAPLATLEAHPLPKTADLSGGIHLESASPLAGHLSQLISHTSKTGAAKVVHNGGETLYRMVVPAKVATQMGSGVLKSMTSKVATGGVHSALVGSSGIAAQATFVPVAGSAANAATGAVGGSAATAGAAVVGASALTVAAPLVLMAVAVGLNARAERNRQQALDTITEMLGELKDNALTGERSALNACIPIIDSASAILLDEGKIGASLGLDTAVFHINVGLANAETRLAAWEVSLSKFEDGRVEVAALEKAFKGIGGDGGEFRTHLELAKLSIDLQQRVAVLQAVEHAQLDPTRLFEGFTQALKRRAQRVVELHHRISTVLGRLSSLEIDRTHGVRDFVFKSSEVDTLLRTSRRVRALSESIELSGPQPDVAIEIARKADGSLVVLPAQSAFAQS
ncbi:hypothetical protein CH281_12090 [Rhodococcus sp. 06-221-2]|uniref:hypothetical protein n=1 Tax=Rhodococcus sp. 06-221-2 TaxID=2022514 RepID=UPI000B9BA50F|nr:hypothetical protein [Rhodococcus sp. 06-221-2]OZD03552.1 hypothetical protein CH281_12090 [Rhodococcus sp. 06-221-2]